MGARNVAFDGLERQTILETDDTVLENRFPWIYGWFLTVDIALDFVVVVTGMVVVILDRSTWLFPEV